MTVEFLGLHSTATTVHSPLSNSTSVIKHNVSFTAVHDGTITSFRSVVDNTAAGAKNLNFDLDTVFVAQTSVTPSGPLTETASASIIVYAGEAHTIAVYADLGGNVNIYGANNVSDDLWAESTITVAPSAPAAPTLVVNSPTSVTVNWVNPGGIISSWNIQRSDDNASWSTIFTGVARGATSFNDNAATSTTGFYRVVAVNTEGTATSPSTGIPVSTPAAPSIAVVSATSNTISWTIPSGIIKSWTVQSSPDNSSWSNVTTGLAPSTTSFTDSGASGRAFYRVVNVNSAASAPSTGTAVATVGTPAAPTVAVNSITSNTVSWAPVTAVGSWTVQASTDNISFSDLVTGLSAATTSYTDSRGGNNALAYRIKAVNSATTATSASTLVPLPTPAAPSIVVNSNTSNTINWTIGANSGDSWTVQSSPDNATWAGASGVLAGGTTSFIDTAAAAGTAFYRMLATNSRGTVAGPSTNLPVPGVIAAPALSESIVTGTVTLSWFPIVNVGAQDIQRSPDNATWATISSNNGAGVSNYSDLLPPTGDLYYRIIGKNSAGSTAGTSVHFTAVSAGVTGAPTLSENLATPWNLTLTWTPTTTLASQNIQRSPDNSTWTTIVTGASAASSAYTDVGVPTGTLYYRVQGVNYQGAVNGTATQLQAPAAMAAPGVAASQVPQGIAVTWTPDLQLGRQRIERSTADNLHYTTLVDDLSPDTSSFVDQSVISATVYFYRIVATNSVSSTTSSDVSITSPAPVMLISFSLSESPFRVALSWVPLTGATGYVPQRGTDNVSFADLGPSQQGTAFFDSSVAVGTAYYYRIKGTSAGGTVFSPVEATYSPGPVAVAAPTVLIDPYNLGGPNVGIFWKPAPTALAISHLSYQVQRSTDNATWTTLASSMASTYWTDTTITASGTYYYRINSVDGYFGIPSASTSIVINMIVPANLTLVQQPGTTTVKLIWDTVPGVTSWAVGRSDDNLTWANLVTGQAAATHSFSDSSPVVLHRYFYRVQAVNGSGFVTGLSKSITIAPTTGLTDTHWILNNTDISTRVKIEGAIAQRQASNQGGAAQFVQIQTNALSPSQLYQPAIVMDGAQPFVAGWVLHIQQRTLSPTWHEADTTVQDAFALMTGCYPDETFEQQTAGWIVKSLLARHLPGLTINNIQPGPVIPYVAFTRQDMASAIRRLLSDAAGQNQTANFYIDANLDCHLEFSNSLPPSPVVMTDSNVLTGIY